MTAKGGNKPDVTDPSLLGFPANHHFIQVSSYFPV